MSLFDKATDVSGKAIDKVDKMVTDELVAKTIIRAGEQKQRINKLLQEKGSDYRIIGIELDDTIPPKVVFITKGPE